MEVSKLFYTINPMENKINVITDSFGYDYSGDHGECNILKMFLPIQEESFKDDVEFKFVETPEGSLLWFLEYKGKVEQVEGVDVEELFCKGFRIGDVNVRGMGFVTGKVLETKTVTLKDGKTIKRIVTNVANPPITPDELAKIITPYTFPLNKA